MFERYTERARRVLFFARYEASQYGSGSIEPEHLLLGIVRESKGLTSRIFQHAGVSLETIRAEIESRMVFREKISTSVELPFSTIARRVLQHAAEEADRLLHSYIGTEHLVLAILREGASPAAAVLTAHGMDLEGVRASVVEQLNAAASTSEASVRSAWVVHHIEQIKELVAQLAQTPRDTAEARALVEHISSALDVLKLPPPDVIRPAE